jgi:hypothetical protein
MRQLSLAGKGHAGDFSPGPWVMITIENPGPQINGGHIAQIEATIGGELPASYKNFLLKNNGGVPTPGTIDIDCAPGSPTGIQVFFGVRRGVESSDLSWNIRFMSERLPSQSIRDRHGRGTGCGGRGQRRARQTAR